jgi:predicted glycoside hydrolase/deacetylase ChbG (UPF0249 family)
MADEHSMLLKRLGYSGDARLLIVTCDGLGRSQAANAAIFDCLHAGLATSASLMVPCPWARHAARQYRGEDVGVSLTLNAPLDHYRWGPITQAPSLLDGDGGFPRTAADLWDHADLDEVRRELRAQIERAIYWGFDVSHLSSPGELLVLRPEFFDVLIELAVDFRLPVRLGAPGIEETAGFPLRKLASDEGVVFPDRVISSSKSDARASLERYLLELAPGVTELQVTPAYDTPEQRALDPSWPRQAADLGALTSDRHLRSMVERSGVELIGYRRLRALMRD